MTDEGKIAAIVYKEAAATPLLRAMPRFGASDSFSDLFGTSEEASEYIVGLLFAGLFVFAICFTWTSIILLFKCLGQRRVGFLSGSAFVKPIDPTARTFNRPFLSRLVFLNASLLFIVFSVLFVTQGLTNLRTTVTTILESSRNINAAMNDLNTLIAEIKVFAANATIAAAAFVNRLAISGQDCLLDALVEEETGTNYAALIANITEVLTNFGISEPAETEELLNTTEFIQGNAVGLDEDVSNVDIGDWQSLIVIIPYIITPSLLMLGVCAAWFEFDLPRLRCLLSWFILPIFVLQVIFAYSFSAAVLIAAAANSDFCSGGSTQTPDGTVYEILGKEGYTKDDLAFRVVAWYVNQCSIAAEDPFQFMLDYERSIDLLKDDIVTFSNSLEEAGNATLSDVCAIDVEFLEGLSQVMTENLQKLGTIALDVVSLMQCSKIVSLYTTPVYDGTCTYSITGVTWAWASFAVVACMGLIMIMLRSTWQLDSYEDTMNVVEIETKVSEDFEDDDQYGGYTGYNATTENFTDESKGPGDDQEQPFGGGGYGQLVDDVDYGDDSRSGEGADPDNNGLPSRM